MSEEVLNAILRLLAIVASEDAVSEEERTFIQNFLRESVDQETARKYMQIFNKLVSEEQNVDLSKNIKKICFFSVVPR